MSTSPQTLADAFRRAPPKPPRPGLDDLEAPGLEAALAALARAASTAWPDLGPINPLALAAHLGASAAGLEAIAPSRAADWALTLLCLEGSSRAIAALEKRLYPSALPALRRLRLDDAAIDDVLARFRVALFVGPEGGAPLLTRYGGKGEPLGWLRVALVREGLRTVRGTRARRDEALELASEIAASGSDPDRAFEGELYGPLFREAFAEGLASLDPKERLLLAQHHVDGLSIDRLADLGGVHRATAARWVAAAREKLVTTTRRAFQDRAQDVDRSACESVLRLLRADFDVTLRRVLAG